MSVAQIANYRMFWFLKKCDVHKADEIIPR